MEKVIMMKKAMEEKEIDIVLLSSADREWTEYRVEQMKKIFRSIDNKVEVIASDSGEKSRSDKGYLPGGTLSIYTGKMAGMIQKDNSRMDKLGRWTSTRVEGGLKAMQVINMYRIPNSTQEGILKSRAQYDRVGGEVKSAKEYRKEVLQGVTKEIQNLNNEGIKGIIVAGDMNQDIGSEEIQ